jgi:hypothetical protein
VEFRWPERGYTPSRGRPALRRLDAGEWCPYRCPPSTLSAHSQPPCRHRCRVQKRGAGRCTLCNLQRQHDLSTSYASATVNQEIARSIRAAPANRINELHGSWVPPKCPWCPYRGTAATSWPFIGLVQEALPGLTTCWLPAGRSVWRPTGTPAPGCTLRLRAVTCPSRNGLGSYSLPGRTCVRCIARTLVGPAEHGPIPVPSQEIAEAD